MIDIIIPVYNTPIKDLERCFNSIMKQTFKEYTVHIIDDGSKEETKLFLDKYSQNKSNFIVKHIKNNGVSNARNYGLDISQNKYIAFVDSDDTITESFLKEAYEIIEKYDLDLIIGGYNEIKNDEITKVRLSTPGIHIYEKEKMLNFLEKLLSGKTNDLNKEINNCPTGRIYTRLFKRSSINNLRFNTSVHMSEDTLFMIDYTRQANKIAVVDKIWYNYYINEYSISNGTHKEKLIHNIETFIEEIIIRYDNELNPRIKKALEERINKANKYIDEIKNSN